MTNPLDPVWQSYRTAYDALRVTRRVIRQNLSGAITDKHCFYAQSKEGALQLIQEAEAELANLTAVAMVAVFERALREHLAEHITRLLPTSPALLAALRGRVLNDAEYWNINSCVLDELFKPVVSADLCGNVKQIIDWRNQVAHGHVRGKKPPKYAERRV
jgi:hypothetical protein